MLYFLLWVAVIKIGAATEVKMKEKKARVEDALHTTRAVVEGVAPGGGIALLRCQKVIKNMSRVIEEPLRQIVQNAGVEPSVIVNQCTTGKGTFGYNAATGEFGDMFEMGILDPIKIKY